MKLSIWKTSPPPRPYHETAKQILHDIHLIKVDIKSLKEKIGNSGIYAKMSVLLDADHKQRASALQRRHNYNTAASNLSYQKELASMYLSFVRELNDFHTAMKNHYTACKVQHSFAEKLYSQSLELEELPEWLLDPISFDILKDPVVTPCGITYEKSHLDQYFKKHGNKDPVTKEPLRPELLAPNLAIKEVVNVYLQTKEMEGRATRVS